MRLPDVRTHARANAPLIRRITVVSALSLLLCGVAAVPAGAADPQVPAVSDSMRADLDAIAQAYRTVYPGMTAGQIQAAIRGRGARMELYTRLGADTASYGGAWFDPRSGVVNVAVTTGAAQAAAENLATKFRLPVRAHRVARSFASLERQATALRTGTDALARYAGGSVRIDVRANRVLVAVPAARLAAARALAASADVAVEANSGRNVHQQDACTSREDCTDSLRAGLVMRRPDGLPCSVGFTAATATARYIYTAGHCSAGIGATWTMAGIPIGPMRAVVDSGRIDAAIIEITDPGFAAAPGGTIFWRHRTDRAIAVVDVLPSRSFMAVGETVCLSANSTKPSGINRCGVIGSVFDDYRGFVRVDGVDSCGGDSGGGWYWPSDQGRWAYGIHHGSDWGCSGSGVGKSAWFTAIPDVYTKFAPRIEVS